MAQDSELKFLGASNISEKNRVTLTKDVVRILEAEIGGKVLYYLDDSGEIIIKASKKLG